jgi:hypothetical protein
MTIQRKPLSDMFDESPDLAELMKFDRSQVLELHSGDLLLVSVSEDYGHEQMDHFRKSLVNLLKPLIGEDDSIKVAVLPAGISFSVIRRAIAEKRTDFGQLSVEEKERQVVDATMRGRCGWCGRPNHPGECERT